MRKIIIGLAVVVLVLAATTVATLRFATERVAGRALAVVEDIPGPETGPICSLDDRYVDEQPDGLRRDVRAAWDRIVATAGEQGVHLCLQDGKRSVAQQEKEFADAVERFGTPELAAKYVLPPDESMHVKGIAVDVQPLSSAAWVEENGPALGWCRRYENEPWHFEFEAKYSAQGCPPLLPSATGS